MTERIPDMDSVHPKWRDALSALRWAERDVAALPRGTSERRAASRRAGKLAKEWRRMHADVAAARRAAGWVQSSPLSWVKLIHRDPEVMFDCECGGNVYQTRRPGRRYQMRTDVFLPVPETFSIPTCDRCDEQYFTVERAEALEAAALAMAYEEKA